MPQVTNPPKRKGRAKNNLSNFDLSQIEADLMAVESESLKLDPQSFRNDPDTETKKEAKSDSSGQKSSAFKTHPVNVVNFNPDNSKLLHKVLRTDTSTAPSPREVVVEKEASKPQIIRKETSKKTEPTKTSAQPLKVNTASSSSPKVGGMDGFKKPASKEATQPKPPVAETIVRPAINTSAVALTGMNRANQFNRYVLEQHKTSLQNQIEKSSLFERSLDGDVEIFDKGLQTNSGKKVYNVRRRESMLGGVDQHDLGPGRVRRALGYRPMRLLMPVFVVLFAGAYVMYLNVPTISIKMAENKAGVAVSEPSYTPDGYKLSGPIEAETGSVAMSFKKSNDESYSVSQKVSDWDSKALLENKILKETKEYSAYTDRGLTIYVYGGKATWVNQGKVYEIELDGSKLDVEDMVRIAGSM